MLSESMIQMPPIPFSKRPDALFADLNKEINLNFSQKPAIETWTDTYNVVAKRPREAWSGPARAYLSDLLYVIEEHRYGAAWWYWISAYISPKTTALNFACR